MDKKDLRLERRQHRWEENKQSILESAERVFAQKSYSLATMDDIAKEAQFSKATLYHYFKSKNEIFFEIILSSFDEIAQKLSKIHAKEKSAVSKLKEIIRFILHFYHEKKHISRIFLMEKSLMMRVCHLPAGEEAQDYEPHAQLLVHVKTKTDHIYRILSEIFAEGIKTEEFRKINVMDACFVLDALLHGFYFKRLWHEREFSFEKSTELIQTFFLYGIKKEERT